MSNTFQHNGLLYRWNKTFGDYELQVYSKTLGQWLNGAIDGDDRQLFIDELERAMADNTRWIPVDEARGIYEYKVSEDGKRIKFRYNSNGSDWLELDGGNTHILMGYRLGLKVGRGEL